MLDLVVTLDIVDTVVFRDDDDAVVEFGLSLVWAWVGFVSPCRIV